jgi:hypothetical protein
VFAMRKFSARVAVSIVVLLVVTPSGVAHADAAKPGNTRSIVESVVPASTGTRFDIVGSDAFMRVRVSRGHAVEISGYEGEPFVKIDRSGTVWVNDRSQTLAISATRYGSSSPVENTAGPTDEEPKWSRVRGDGTYVWHDHRVHWMSPTTPPTLNDVGLVQKWALPVRIDGVATVVSGSLYMRAAPGSWWWIVGIVALVAMLFASRILRAVTLALAGAVTTTVGALAYWGMPDGTRPSPTLFVLGVAALVIVVAGLVVRRQDDVFNALLASSAIASVVFVFLARDFIAHRFVPGIGDQWWIRVVLPMVAGCAVAVAARSMRALMSTPKK